MIVSRKENMEQMKKRVLCLVLALVLMTSTVLAGCGSDPRALMESIAEKAKSAIEEGLDGLSDSMDSLGDGVNEVVETLEEALDEVLPETETTSADEEKESSRVTLSHGDSWQDEEETEEDVSETSAEEAGDLVDTEAGIDLEECAAFLEFTNSLIDDFFEGDTFDAHYYFMHPEDFGISMDEAGLPAFAYTEEDDADTEAFYRESLERLAEFDYNKLDRASQITYDVVKDYFETELSAVDFDYYYEPLCGTSGYQSSLPVMFAEYKFFDVHDVEMYISYLNQMPDHFRDLLLYEQQKADAGLFMEDALAQEVIDQIESFLETESDEDNFLYSSFESKVAELDLTEEEKQNYIRQNREAAPHFYEAYRILRDGMQELLGSNQYQGGLCNYPEGAAYYEYLIKTKVGTSMTPEELLDYLEEKEAEYINELTLIYRKHPSVVTQMDSFPYPSTDPEEIMPMLIKAASENFPELSEVQYNIKYVDASLRDYLNPAFYIIPPFGEGSVNEIYINPDEDGNVSDDIWTTLAHEGYPGHLYQYNYWAGVNSFAIRNLMDPTGYAEGWAQHAEHTSYYFVEDADTNVVDFMRANSLATMAIYGLLDLGIHYQGWTVDELREFLTANFGALDEETVVDMYNYLVGNPAEYMQYAAGEFEMMDIIDDYTEDGDVDMKEFYREYLMIGPAPFDIIRKYLGIAE